MTKGEQHGNKISFQGSRERNCEKGVRRAGGPAIGGGQDEVSRAAADELSVLSKNAEPSDYDWEGYDMDGPCTIKMGVRNGKPYYEEREMEG